MPKKNYLVLVAGAATRDTQVCPDNNLDPMNDWADWPDAELFIGIRHGTEQAVRAWGAQYANTHPDNIRLIDLDNTPFQEV